MDFFKQNMGIARSVSDQSSDQDLRSGKRRWMSTRDLGKTIFILIIATLIGSVFYMFGFTEANIIAVYLLAVLVNAVITASPLCGLTASVISVLVFNFFFTAPRFTFRFHDPNYFITMPIMFMVAFLTGSLASRLKESAKQSERAAFRMKILLETNQLLRKENEEGAVIDAMAGQLTKLLKRDIVIYLSDSGELTAPHIYQVSDHRTEDLVSETEKRTADWVLHHNGNAGAATGVMEHARCMYLAISANRQVYGVVGIEIQVEPMDSFEGSVVSSILGEGALALESIRNAKEKENAAILAKNEQLRANLLRSISHDLRTPLTSISGSASNLLSNYQKMDDDTRTQTFTDIYDDAQWLINLVENLLAISRIEGGGMNLTTSVELMNDVVDEAMRHVDRHSSEHTIRVSTSDELILARINARLVIQVIINLVNNAVKYTPPGSEIEVNTEKRGQWVMVTVADNGVGIPEEQKTRIFDMFYSGTGKIADSRRSLGLGLALCKSIITAHGGKISVADHSPCGAVFTFTLPAEEVDLNE